MRVVSHVPAAVAALRRHREHQHAADRIGGLVFTSSRGTPLIATHVHEWRWKPLLQGARLPDVTFHSIESGVPLPVVQRILGHANVRGTVDVYGHVGGDALWAGIDRLGEAISVRIRRCRNLFWYHRNKA